MNILILGSGGRECAFAAKISQSSLITNLFIAPGNGGTVNYGKNVNIKLIEFEQIGKFCIENDIQLVIVGPEDPLVKGIVDFFNSNKELQHIAIVGPNSKAAQLEGSKAFAKAFMKKNGIPTADYASFTADEINEAYCFLHSLSSPYVIKADGLAAGKGVIICNTIEEAKATVKQVLIDKKFGDAGSKVVIEKYLSGKEVSFFALLDGEHYLLLPEAKDYKRISDGDRGPNTGGMGAVSPVPFISEDFKEKVCKKIIEPTIEGLKKEGITYKGFLFLGLMNVNNEPFVIEYNVRMGDPETQVVLPRIKNDLIELCMAVHNNTLDRIKLDIVEEYFVNVVLASQGYPGEFEKNKKITIQQIPEKTSLIHAGTSIDNEKNLYTTGGRVFSCIGWSTTLPEAIQKAYELVEQVNFENKYFRTDIGKDLM